MGSNPNCRTLNYNIFDRLSMRQINNLDVIRESVPKPLGYLPPRSLPSWKSIPVDQKIPLIPAPQGAIYYTRADLGKTLLRKGGPYQILDPWNRERIPSDKTYEELHDPYPQIERSPQITKRLLELDLINDDGEALCLLREFNRYRLYLGTLYNDKVKTKLALMDDLARFQLEETRAFLAQERRDTSGKLREERFRQIAEHERQRQSRIRMMIYERDLKMRENMDRLDEERRRKQAALFKRNESMRILRNQKVKEVNKRDKKRRTDVLHRITLKDMTANAFRQHVAQNKKINNDKRIAEWFDAKLLSSAQRLEQEQEIQMDFNNNLKKRAVARQKRVEKSREELPYRIARRIAAEKRLNNIVRKYAMRWLNRVRDRLNKPKDEAHESLWCPPNGHALQDCLTDLYDKSGHAKLDDLVMNVLLIKEAIKKQLALEEAEEAAQEKRRSIASYLYNDEYDN